MEAEKTERKRGINNEVRERRNYKKKKGRRNYKKKKEEEKIE